MLGDRKLTVFDVSNSLQEGKDGAMSTILDAVSSTVDENRSDIQTSESIKKKIEKELKGQWQVLIGREMHIYFEESIIRDFLKIQTESKLIIIFRRANPSSKQ